MKLEKVEVKLFIDIQQLCLVSIRCLASKMKTDMRNKGCS
jgi:hypothetical protein